MLFKSTKIILFLENIVLDRKKEIGILKIRCVCVFGLIGARLDVIYHEELANVMELWCTL